MRQQSRGRSDRLVLAQNTMPFPIVAQGWQCTAATEPLWHHVSCYFSSPWENWLHLHRSWLRPWSLLGLLDRQQSWILIWGKLKTLLEEWIYIKCRMKIFYIWNLQITIIDKRFQYRNIACCPDILTEVSFSPPMIYWNHWNK